MEKKWNKKMWYGILIIVCLILIFFVGRFFNSNTGKRSLGLTTHGVQYFRKGLDVSGGTKLVYKISYDKYEEVYEGAELESIKKTIENIILKNIDNRISSLGVSDYKAYTEIMDGSSHYIVVEIGGVADLDQAKEIIGKTVELEFRLPNTEEITPATISERSNFAISVRDEIVLTNGEMEKIASNRGSEGIVYSHYTGISAGDMPDIVRSNPELLDTKVGEISPIVEGVYYTLSYQDLSGIVQQEVYSGFTFLRINDKQEVSIQNATANDIVNVITEMGNKYEENIVKTSSQEAGKYGFENGNLVYNLGAISDADSALSNVRIVQVATENAGLGADEDAQNQVNESNNQKIQEVQNTIVNSSEFDSSYATLLADTWASNDDIKNIIDGFDETKVGEVQVISGLTTTYVVYIKEGKAKGENLYEELVVYDVDQAAFEKALESKVVYDVEFVFIRDHIERVTAKSSQGDILNGAYFKYAVVGQGQLGEPVVTINFDDKGKEVFCNITAENVGTQMAIFVGGENLTSPVIQAKICGGTAQIDGSFTSESAKELVDNLNNGAMPASLVLMQEDKISPTLGDKALQGALLAALVGTLAIFAYIWLVYGRRKGTVTLLVLLSFIIVLAGIMKLIDYALSLSGIAAVILSIGMAVDSNILIYERMKEETNNGRSNQSAIDTAYDRSWPAIRDGNISTGLIALLLFSLGSNMFKGFGAMLLITTIMTLLINVPLTKILLKLFYRNDK